MTWHTATVPTAALAALLARIRSHGGTVTGSRPEPAGVHVTWTSSWVDTDLDAFAPTTGPTVRQ